MENKNNDLIFKQKMVKLLRIFNKYPFMFTEFLLKNEAITPAFKKKLVRSFLKDKKHDVFIDIEKMLDYYDGLINEKDFTKTKDQDYWNNKLIDAINLQKFEEAASIRDYMNLHNLVIKIKQN